MQEKWNGPQEDQHWNGEWIWDVQQPEEGGSTEHRLVYFRRTFLVAEGTKPKLIVDITADSRYRLFVNGRSLRLVPARETGIRSIMRR